MVKKMQNNLTIAICTYNRAHILPKVLTSLLQQTVSPENYFLLIINNNSTDNTQEIAVSFKDKFTYIRIIQENNQGLSHARNRALKECQTEWLAFLDDDAKAHPDWIETVLRTINKGDFDAFGGPFYAWHHYGPPPHWLPEDFGSYESPQGYGQLEGSTYIPGGNCVLRCDAARRIETFSTELGMKGNRCCYGEETLFFERMRAAGYRLGYVPQLRIDHCVLPYKYTLRWQIRSAFEYGKAAAIFPENIKKFVLLRCLWHCFRSLFCILSDIIRCRKDFTLNKIIFIHIRPLIHDAGFLYQILLKSNSIISLFLHKLH